MDDISYTVELKLPKPNETYAGLEEHIRVLALIAYHHLAGSPLNQSTLREKVIEMNKNLPGEGPLKNRKGYIAPKRAIEEAELFVKHGRITKDEDGFYLLKPEEEPEPIGIYHALERCGWVHLHKKGSE